MNQQLAAYKKREKINTTQLLNPIPAPQAPQLHAIQSQALSSTQPSKQNLCIAHECLRKRKQWQ